MPSGTNAISSQTPEKPESQPTHAAGSAGTTALTGLLVSTLAVIQRIADPLLRLGLGLVLLWIGLDHFHDPSQFVRLTHASILYRFLASTFFAYGLGILEILAALLLFANVRVRYVGLGVALLFVGTLSIFLTTPAVVFGSSFPFLSPTGEFLLKDVVLLAATLKLVASDAAAHTHPTSDVGSRVVR